MDCCLDMVWFGVIYKRLPFQCIFISILLRILVEKKYIKGPWYLLEPFTAHDKKHTVAVLNS